MSEMKDKAYFRYPHPFWVVSISFGMWLLTMSRFFPTYIPRYLGPVGQFGTYVGVTYPKCISYLFIAAWSLHALEAVIAFRICRSRRMETMTTLKWTVQTLLFGFASMIRLVSQKKIAFIPGSAKAK
ncbi:transmembrane protein 254-like [Liolophura sinensis]|uniref:transmembrane protein 254-like n=1 Tax=Liolophura sinensis TaxID=3198878 RepID=UPI003158A59A